MTKPLKAPFPYFGGKSAVAKHVWAALGNPKHYLEPFFGSGAVLLARPEVHRENMESVCDKDGFLANAWRGMKFAPDEVAKWCDWPVNHADLSARKKRLIENDGRLLENLIADDMWFDATLAGYWIWAASCWIGSGLTSLNAIPHLTDARNGVHALGKIPHLTDAGKGVHALGQRPHLSHAGMGVAPVESAAIYEWFARLSARLRRVRVVCGDWTRICGGKWQDYMGLCGMFFDPPYGVEDRYADVYHHDSTTVAREVGEWCLDRGANPRYRIVIAGYDGEYPALEAAGWRVMEWKANSGYGNIASGQGQGKANSHRERLWFSPHCLNPDAEFQFGE